MTSKTATAGSDADRQAVLDVLARLYRAWEAGDAEAFVADYTEDASVIQPGVYEKDREEIRTTIAAGFAGPLSGSRVAARPDPNVPGPQPRCHGRDRQSKTVWTWSAERKEP